MPFHEKAGLRFFAFQSFPSNVKQAVFTRRGGVSPAPWSSLNVGGSVGDEKTRVAENRIRSFQALEVDPASIHDVWLVHGTNIVHAEAPRPLEQPSPQADILLTDNPRVTLFMRFGDCTPLFFYDSKKGVIGLAHAGWQGTVQDVAGAAVRGMQARYGCDPQDIFAAIGPAIGVDHYEVGEDVISRVLAAFGKDADAVIETRNGNSYFDLWKANELQLRRAGVEQIEVSALCTACSLEDWFSHRAERGKTGRFGALLALQA
ncbi:MAG: peptidoglycan editing factor PgeF [Anaerolineales bacterium]|nr:peptidoglycan editing factor PgeF [Anaerolineales bacterium]